MLTGEKRIGSIGKMLARLTLLTAVAVAIAGCSSGSGLTTGSTATVNPAGPVVPKSDPSGRALQVGSVSARATRCGYNFDSAKLKTKFLASEAGLGSPPADIAKLDKIYDVSYNGVTKAVAEKGDYCSDNKTAKIKADLNRHLAGDFTPSAREVRPEEPSLFSGVLGDATESNSASDAMAQRQIDAKGR